MKKKRVLYWLKIINVILFKVAGVGFLVIGFTNPMIHEHALKILMGVLALSAGLKTLLQYELWDRSKHD